MTKGGRLFTLLVQGPAELATVGEVLVDDLYAVEGVDDARVIVDLGSHIGTSIVFFRQRYPGARIYGFEPDPDSFRALEANVGALEGVTVDPRAVAAGPGEALLHASPNSLASSLVTGNGRDVPVRTVGLDGIFEEVGFDAIDMLKLDVEGAEHDVIANTTRLGSVRAIAGELHPGLVPVAPEAFFALLADFDVRVDVFSAASWQFSAVRR
ncbi:MAG TPA: FkbM family methyltransferase [Solirubrobacteraceae bacterium]|nr:FkbM family methyltransferase [Solirubrobacteraceae bacterium]